MAEEAENMRSGEGSCQPKDFIHYSRQFWSVTPSAKSLSRQSGQHRAQVFIHKNTLQVLIRTKLEGNTIFDEYNSFSHLSHVLLAQSSLQR
jgi:hypothetical protein